ncbi:MAG: hypothetical protein ACYC8W_07855 [Candidatus Tyrphobacter sp.]
MKTSGMQKAFPESYEVAVAVPIALEVNRDQVVGKSVTIHAHDGAPNVNAVEFACRYKNEDSPHGPMIQGKFTLCRLEATARRAGLRFNYPTNYPTMLLFGSELLALRETKTPDSSIESGVSNWWR